MDMLTQKHLAQDVEKEEAHRQAMAIAQSLGFLAHIALCHGDDALAHMLNEESLVFMKELDYKEHIGSCLERLASIAAEQERPTWASRLYQLAVSLHKRLLPPSSTAREWKSTVSKREPVAFFAASTPTLGAHSSISSPNGLTAREAEVLRLVALGLTNAQIADRLVISPRTVNYHLTSIYKKLQVPSRNAATRYAIEHHLI